MFRGSNHHESAVQGMLDSNADVTRAVGGLCTTTYVHKRQIQQALHGARLYVNYVPSRRHGGKVCRRRQRSRRHGSVVVVCVVGVMAAAVSS